MDISKFSSVDLKENVPLGGNKEVPFQKEGVDYEKGGMSEFPHSNSDPPTGDNRLVSEYTDLLKKRLKSRIASTNLHDEASDVNVPQSAK